jgi:sugar phosphate isomerase/epimerase
MIDRFSLSLRCRSLWDGPRPVAPPEFLLRLPEELGRLRTYGAALVDFEAEVCSVDRRYRDPEIWERIADCVRDGGLSATVHLPSVWVDLASLDAEVWEGSARSVETALRATAPLRPALATVHPGSDATGAWLHGLPPAEREAATRLALDRVVDGLRRLRELKETEPLALENLEGVTCELIAVAAARSDVGICLDVGHVLSNGEDLVAAIDAVAPRLRGVHLHDAKPPAVAGGKGLAHLPLGGGTLDLETLIAKLRNKGFRGPVVLEVPSNPAGSARRFLDMARRTSGVQHEHRGA